MPVAATKRRNVLVVVQTRDLDEIRSKIEKAVRKFDSAAFELMPGIWHLAAVATASSIRLKVVGAVSDWEDDRVVVIDDPNGIAAWDGHRGQHVRFGELKERWVRTTDIKRGKSVRSRQSPLKALPSPQWVTEKRKTGTKIV